MLFNSYVFIFAFLPMALTGYFVLNHFKFYRGAKLFLVGMSLWFYAYFHFSYLWILLCSISVNYVCHLLLVRKFHVRLTASLGICLNVGILFYFKYFDFVLENLNQIFHTDFTPIDMLLPLGISFFTFQQIAFLADTARGTVGRQDFVDYALFVTFFPQLIAGPIVSHEEMLPQFRDLTRKRLSAENVYWGLRIFVLGLSKKILLADTLGQAVNWGFQYYTVLDGLNTFLVALFYSMQLYFDFSGYCDMARGIGYLFNIRIPFNFLSPYKSANILEFWERWHITLTRFFTRYVYYPLGGNRRGVLRTYFNVFLVFCISGIWHGAGWNFLVWGMLHGGLSVLTRLWHRAKKNLLSKHSFRNVSEGRVLKKILRGISVVLTFFFLTGSWVIFRADSFSQAGYMLKNMLSFKGSYVYRELAIFFQPWSSLPMHKLPYGIYYFMAGYMIVSLGLIFFSPNLYESEKKGRTGIFGTCCLAILAVWCVLSLSGVSTFLYFNF